MKHVQLVLDLGMVPVVPPKSNPVDPSAYDRALYNKRNEIERLFHRLKGFRRVCEQPVKWQWLAESG